MATWINLSIALKLVLFIAENLSMKKLTSQIYFNNNLMVKYLLVNIFKGYCVEKMISILRALRF